jgi:hypothetical protein
MKGLLPIACLLLGTASGADTGSPGESLSPGPHGENVEAFTLTVSASLGSVDQSGGGGPIHRFWREHNRQYL